jgi:hypothetical protein
MQYHCALGEYYVCVVVETPHVGLGPHPLVAR